MSQLFALGGPKYWSFSFIMSPSNEYPGLISFRMDWLDLLAVQGSLKRQISDLMIIKHQGRWKTKATLSCLLFKLIEQVKPVTMIKGLGIFPSPPTF